MKHRVETRGLTSLVKSWWDTTPLENIPGFHNYSQRNKLLFKTYIQPPPAPYNVAHNGAHRSKIVWGRRGWELE